jgi:hypothetical protein
MMILSHLMLARSEIGLSLLLAFAVLQSKLEAAQHSLFTKPATESSGYSLPPPRLRLADSPLRAARRVRRVHINPAATNPDQVMLDDEIVIDLFDGIELRGVVDWIDIDSQGVVSVRGRFPGCDLGHLLLSRWGGRSLITIAVPESGIDCAVLYDPVEASHLLLDIDRAALGELEGAPPVIPPGGNPDGRPPGGVPPGHPSLFGLGASDPAMIDVMIVYTPAARQWATTYAGGINLVINQAMQKAQLTHDNSLTGITLRLARAAEITYTESGNSSLDLVRLQANHDGYMDAVHSWRNTYGADLVVLLARIEDAGGIGYLLGNLSGESAFGFCVSRVQQTASSYTTVHELGHNLGCGHHKDQFVQPGPGLLSYAAGWRWVASNGQRWCSVMCYESGGFYPDGQTHTRVAYFSSPLIYHSGALTGNAVNGDNRRMLREVKHVVAGYRAPSNNSFASAYSLSGSSGTTTGNNLGATKESGEPLHAGNSGGKSVWWRWTAPASGAVTFDTLGSSFDTLLAAYTGTTVSSLTLKASNNDINGSLNRQSHLTFSAVSGTTYCIAVDGYNAGSGAVSGNLKLNWSMPLASTSAAWVTSLTPGPLERDYGGWRGLCLKTGANTVQVTALGRVFISGNTQNHELILVHKISGTTVASALWTPAGGAHNQIKYIDLPTPVTLAAHTEYYLASQETAGADFYYTYETKITTTSVASVLSAARNPSGTWSVVSTPGSTYGPVGFKYTVGTSSALATMTVLGDLRAAREQDAVILEYIRPTAGQGIDCVLEMSDDLQSWISLEGQIETEVTPLDAATDRVRARYPVATDPASQRCFRLRLVPSSP